MLRKNPDRCIERTGVVGTGNEELEVTAAGFVSIANPPSPISRTLDPLDDPAAVDTFDPAQRVPHEGQPPRYWCCNVGTKRIAVNADDGIAGRGNGDAAERGPEQWRRRNEAA